MNNAPGHDARPHNRHGKPAAVLGLKLGPQHDTGACVVRETEDGTLRCTAIAEERLNREKHSRKFPERAIAYCLEQHGLTLDEINLIAIDTLSPLDLPGDVNWLHDCGTITADRFHRDNVAFLSKLQEGNRHTAIINHHAAHAASAYHTSGFNEAAILVADGSGSAWPTHESDDRNMWIGPAGRIDGYALRRSDRRRETQTIFHGQGRSIRRLAVSTLSGVGHFYTWMSERVVGFGHLEEGKLMGLAAWGEGHQQPDWPSLPSSAVHDGINTTMLDHVARLGFNPPLRPADTPPTDPFYAGLSNWAEEHLQHAMEHLARTALQITGSTRLCLAGGVALNVVANRAILDWMPGRMYIQPAASDMGMPLGAALYGYYNILNGTHNFQSNLAYLGRSYDDATMERAIIDRGGEVVSSERLLDRRVAELLKANLIVGWFQGPSEYGPRALGNRSILCSPREPWMKDHLNARVKHREGFRPFAPIVREERAPLFFDLYHPAPHMLFNAVVHHEYRDKLPAITHVDGTARLQTVSLSDNPRMYRLLRAFEKVDEFGVLLNTSFNDAGEPIVETPDDACRCFDRTGLDALVCGNAVLVKRDVARLHAQDEAKTSHPASDEEDAAVSTRRPPTRCEPASDRDDPDTLRARILTEPCG